MKYPDGKDSLPFENVYGKSANAEIALNGKKVYEKESVNAPDIAGKYTFTITGTDELGNPAPMPVKDGKVVTETTNDAAGNIDFGKLVYTMENVFGSAESQDEQTNANQDVEAGEDPADTNQNAEAGQDPAAAIQRKIRRRQKMRQTRQKTRRQKKRRETEQKERKRRKQMKQTLKQTADRTPDQAEKIRTKKRQERLRRTAETSLIKPEQ